MRSPIEAPSAAIKPQKESAGIAVSAAAKPFGCLAESLSNTISTRSSVFAMPTIHETRSTAGVRPSAMVPAKNALARTNRSNRFANATNSGWVAATPARAPPLHASHHRPQAQPQLPQPQYDADAH